MDKRIFIANLVYLRKADTQTGIANKIGISVQRYNNWELGKVMPNLTELNVLSDFYCITESTLLHTFIDGTNEQTAYKEYRELQQRKKPARKQAL